MDESRLVGYRDEIAFGNGGKGVCLAVKVELVGVQVRLGGWR